MMMMRYVTNLALPKNYNSHVIFARKCITPSNATITSNPIRTIVTHQSSNPLIHHNATTITTPAPPPSHRPFSTSPPSPISIQRPIFVAATKQHVGKTSVSLGIVSGLQKRFPKVGFIKPVGQQHVPVHSPELSTTIRVDKDVCLIREHFQLTHVDYQYMSPVIIPRGYTKDYVDGKISHEGQLDDIYNAVRELRLKSDILLCEGTGHCAVGSIVNLNNAKGAAMMGADMVLVANGGLGSAIDELELNRILCQHHGVRLAGVVINKVLPEKYEQTKEYMTKALTQMWGVPLLGCVPDKPFLGYPALADLERLYDTKLICGDKHRMSHYDVHNTNLVTTSLSRFLENLRSKPSRTLYFCHSTRNDVILGFLGEYQRRQKLNEPFEAALFICGRKDKYPLSTEIHEMMQGVDAPVLVVEYSTHQAMERLHHFIPKLNIDDKVRVQACIDHYEQYIDFDQLLRRTTDNNASYQQIKNV